MDNEPVIADVSNVLLLSDSFHSWVKLFPPLDDHILWFLYQDLVRETSITVSCRESPVSSFKFAVYFPQSLIPDTYLCYDSSHPLLLTIGYIKNARKRWEFEESCRGKMLEGKKMHFGEGEKDRLLFTPATVQIVYFSASVTNQPKQISGLVKAL